MTRIITCRSSAPPRWRRSWMNLSANWVDTARGQLLAREFHQPMGNGGLFEHVANRIEAALQIEAFNRDLRMQIDAMRAGLARRRYQVIEHQPSDSTAAPVGQHRHPANLGTIMRLHHPAASDGLFAVEREDVDSTQIVDIVFEVGVDSLFLDEHPPPDCI